MGPLPLNQDKVCSSAHIRGLLCEPTSPVEIPIFLHTLFSFIFFYFFFQSLRPQSHMEFPIPSVGEKGCFLELHNTMNYNHTNTQVEMRLYFQGVVQASPWNGR